MRWFFRLIFLVFFITFGSGCYTKLLSQNSLGVPLVQIYSPKVYKGEPINWCVAQHSATNLLYVGNANGILEYDGSRWRSIKVVGDVVRSIVDYKGVMYVGTANDFGRLVSNSQGVLVYESLSSLLLNKDEVMQSVWSIFVCKGDIYFNTQDEIFKYNPNTQKSQRLLIKDGVYSFFMLKDDDLIIQTGAGYLQLNPDMTLNKTSWLNPLMEVNATSMIDQRECWLGFGHDYGEIMICDKKTQSVKRVKTSSSDEAWLKHVGVYVAKSLNDSMFVLGTKGNGIGIWLLNADDASAQMLYLLNREQGILSDNVNEFAVDSEGGLWTAHDVGLSRTCLNLPYTAFRQNEGIQTRVMSIISNYENGQNYVYAGTNNGLKLLNKQGVFEAIEGNTTQVWDLQAFQQNTAIAAAGNNGFFHLKEGKIKQLVGSSWSTMSIAKSKIDSNLVYVGLYNGFRILRYEDNRFKLLAELPALKQPNRSIVEDADGSVWIGSTFAGFFRLQLDRSLPIEKAAETATIKLHTEGIKELKGCRVDDINGKTYFYTEQGYYTFNNQRQVFEPVDLWGINWQNPPYRRSIQGNWQPDEKTFWLKNAKQILSLLPNGNVQIDSLSLKPILGNILSVHRDQSNIIWIGSTDDLKRVTSINKTYQAPSVVFRRIVSTNTDSLLWGGAGSLPELSSLVNDHRSLLLEFACLGFTYESETLFQYYLEGYDTEWSDWTNEAKKEYTNLFEGRYSFKVRAKNALGQISDTQTLEFCIEPPVYRHPVAYGLYALLLIVFVIVVVNLNALRLKKKQVQLEQLIKERTQEIQLKNVELEQQKEEIIVQAENLKEVNKDISLKSKELERTLAKVEEQSQHITASINYAKRIQNAILPTNEEMRSVFSSHFVLFKPRDIVSGDFYWLARAVSPQLAHISVIAVADCTGHGVPGAFMSLIGNEILSEIVYNRAVWQPNRILELLHSRIQDALKQKENKNRDGMDISVCAIDRQAKKLWYAGAHNPLVYIRGSELIRIKADKYAIGGHDFAEKPQFTLHGLDLLDQEGQTIPTLFYLFSDGIQDQFGGKEVKKFMLRNLENLLLANAHLTMLEQQAALDQSIKAWTEGHKQIDDMLLIGFTLNL